MRLGLTYWVTILLVVTADCYLRQWFDAPTLTLEEVSWQKLAANLFFLQDILGYGNISAGTWFVCVDIQLSILFVVLMMLAQPLSLGLAKLMRSESAARRGGAADVLSLSLLFLPLGLLSLCWLGLDESYDAWIPFFFFMPLLVPWRGGPLRGEFPNSFSGPIWPRWRRLPSVSNGSTTARPERLCSRRRP